MPERSRRSPEREAPLLDVAEAGGAGPPAAGGDPPAARGDDAVALHEAAQSRYLNYALSVITSRALPDVRDGLKPVQRRILTRCGSSASPPTPSRASARRWSAT